MKNTFYDLIEQSHYFPQDGFDIQDGYVSFHGLSLKYLINKYGTPLRLMYLPKIGAQIKRARNLFNRSIRQNNYQGKYHFCYCTKCNHFYHVINEALKHKVNIETSSAFDIDLIFNFLESKKIEKTRTLIHNGYKTDEYLSNIKMLIDAGFTNSITIIDSIREIDRLLEIAGNRKIKIGIRMAINEEPQSAYYTSRLGIQPRDILPLYHEKIKDNPNLELVMVHHFIDSGIADRLYYWGEFQKVMEIYVKLRKDCDTLNALNIGGGFPIRNSLSFEYDYGDIINQIVTNIKDACSKENIPDPDIYTEFGKYTVGESGAIIFKVLEQKQQNDSELWYIVDNSLMNTIPDAWSIYEKFILLPINKWNNEYTQVNIGGISCDHSDYYNTEDLNQQVMLPKIEDGEKEPLYVGFFHTGAYQDSISGYGGIKHCLIPSPKYVIIDRDESGHYIDYVYRNEQLVSDMFSILGYNKNK